MFPIYKHRSDRAKMIFPPNDNNYEDAENSLKSQ